MDPDATAAGQIFEPEDRAILMRAPDGVEVLQLNHHHMREPTLCGSVSPEQYQDEINERKPRRNA